MVWRPPAKPPLRLRRPVSHLRRPDGEAGKYAWFPCANPQAVWPFRESPVLPAQPRLLVQEVRPVWVMPEPREFPEPGALARPGRPAPLAWEAVQVSSSPFLGLRVVGLAE